MRKLTALCGVLLAGTASLFAQTEGRLSTPLGGSAFGGFSIANERNQQAQSIGEQVLNGTVFDISKRTAKSPLKIGASGANMYGWLYYYEPKPTSYSSYGFTEIGSDLSYNIKGFGFEAGCTYPGFFIRDGKACTYAAYDPSGQVLKYMYLEYDLATGEMVTNIDIPLEGTHIIYQSLAYDSDADMVYGYSYGNSLQTGTRLSFIKSDPKNPAVIMQITDVNRSQRCLHITYNQDEQMLVGVNCASEADEFVKIDPVTGDQTVLKVLPDVDGSRQFWKGGLCWSPKDKKYVWNYNVVDGNKSILAFIDPENDYEITTIGVYPKKESFVGFYCTDKAEVADQAPADAILREFNFNNGSLAGSIVYQMPTETGDGTPIIGNVSYTVLLDDVVYKNGMAPAGELVTINFDELEEGNHSFKIFVTYNGVEGRMVKDVYWIGFDTPMAPANVQINNSGLITWDPVTFGIYNGYINTQQMTYNVYVNNRLVGRNVKTASYEYTFPADSEMTLYTVQVEASCNGRVSDLSEAATCVHGNPFTIPVYIEPSTAQKDLFTVIDANRDRNTFGHYIHDDNKGYFWMPTDRGGDDWLILPAIMFPSASSVYEFSMKAATRKEGCSEFFEVWMGDEPTVEAMTQPVMGRTNANQEEFTEYSSVISVTAPGPKYIGIHCTSYGNSFRLYVRDFQVNNSAISDDAPDSPTDVNITYDDRGYLYANVAFTMPFKTISGKDLPVDEDLTALVSCSNSGQTLKFTGKPGQKFETRIQTVQGNNYVVVEVSNENGAGRPAGTNVYCGLDIPAAPSNFKIFPSQNNMDVEMTWEAPTEGLHGGYVNPKSISYYLARYNTSSGGFEISTLLGNDVYSALLRLPEGISQQVSMFGVVAANTAGQSTKVAGGSVLVGKPFEMPLREEYPNGTLTYAPFVAYSPDADYSADVTWNVQTPASVGAKYALEPGKYAVIGRTNRDNDKGRFGIPKFATTGAINPSLFLDLYVGGCKDVEVLANCYGLNAPVSLGKVSTRNLAEGYQTIEFKLPAQFKNQQWVELFIDATFEGDKKYCIVPGYVIKDSQPRDLGVISIEGTESALIDNEANYTVTVANEGYEAYAFGGAEWTLTNSKGEVLITKEVPAEDGLLQPGERKTFTFSFTPDANMAGDLSLKFALTGGDLNNINDTMSIKISVSSGTSLVVTDLRAVDSDGSSYVDLAWTEPNLGNGAESFEDEKAYVGTPATIAGFTNIDRDKAYVYGITNLDYPNMGMPGAWIVWNPKQLGGTAVGRYPVFDGDQFIMALAPDVSKGDVSADDWLISPAVAGGTEVMFAARALTYQFGAEKVEVLYSTTDREPESFKLLKAFTIEGGPTQTPTWAEYMVTLPEDAVYFALRYVSYNTLGLMIDKIQWTPFFSGLTIDGYDIYRDNECIDTKADAHGSYRDATITDGNTSYAYQIVPVLSNNQRGVKSNIATVQPSGVDDIVTVGAVTAGKGKIMVNGLTGSRVIIFSADGKTVAADKNVAASVTYDVEPGVYMVVADRTYKVIVP